MGNIVYKEAFALIFSMYGEACRLFQIIVGRPNNFFFQNLFFLLLNLEFFSFFLLREGIIGIVLFY